ncbi:MAG: Rieske (2Fe-2S) protein [Armatimonadetes bacterium]|nr:Rieske (2Fe-2S) protein [Armatimonadota bacterium]
MMEEQISRRKLLDKFVKFAATLTTAILSVPPLVMLVVPAFRREQTPWLRVGPISDFRPNEPKAVTLTYQRRDGWVIRTVRTTVYVVVMGEGKVKVLSNICTHANCAVRWEKSKQAFFCPCHDGYFAIDGSVKSGPPTRPLDEFLHKIEGGFLFVRLS